VRSANRKAIAGIINREYLLSGYTRQAQLEGRGPPLLTERSARQAMAGAPQNVGERIDRLLLSLGAIAGDDHAHDFALRGNVDYPLGYCKNAGGFNYLLGYLQEEALFGAVDMNSQQLTVRGWERIRALREDHGHGSQVFVAMPFGEEYRATFDEALEPAIRAAGYAPNIMSESKVPGVIDVQMLLEIRRSRLLVAEMTGTNAGAYFEAGYALGRGIPVIFCLSQAESIRDQHFDTRHHNYIHWANLEELENELQVRIEFAIGKGPNPVGAVP
jgi:hypothetical protein